MEDSAGGVEGLQIVLNIQGCENVLGVTNGQVAGVGVVGAAAVFGSGNNVRVTLHIVLGKTVGGGLCGGSFQIVQVAVQLLIVGKALTHMIEHILREFLALFGGHIGANPLSVQAALVHTHETNGGEVVIESSQIVLGVGVQTAVKQLGDDLALDI